MSRGGEPQALAGLGEMLAGLEPTWHTCPKCGVESAWKGPCFDCTRVSDAARSERDIVDATLATVLADYRIPFDTQTLRARNVPPRAIAAAGKALEERFVVIVGPPTGKGKSSLAGAMLGAWARKTRRPGLWLPAWDLCGGELRFQTEWLESALVVIDDLGNERDMKSSLVPEILERRKSDQRPLWLTTSLTEAACALRYGANNARRVFERALVIDCGGGR